MDYHSRVKLGQGISSICDLLILCLLLVQRTELIVSTIFVSQQYHANFPEQNAPASSPPQQTRPVVRKSAKWDAPEHKLFIATCEIVISEGHQRGKCFSATGWQRICAIFNGKAGKNWTISQLKNYWSKLRAEHKHVFELLRCSGIGYNSVMGLIVAPEHWWVDKIKENRKYAKYKDMNCNEIYETYGKLFGDTGDSTKYAFSPSKLSQQGFDLDTDSVGDITPIMCILYSNQHVPFYAHEIEIEFDLPKWNLRKQAISIKVEYISTYSIQKEEIGDAHDVIGRGKCLTLCP